MRCRRWKVAALAGLVACASNPRPPREGARTEATPEVPQGFPADTVWYEEVELKPRVVESVQVTQAEFERELVAGWKQVPWAHSPQEMAEEVFGKEGEAHMVAEVYRGKVYSLYVVDEDSPLVMVEEGEMRERYWEHCARHHPGAGKDCLELLKEGGPYLGAADRRMLMLDLAMHPVLEKSKEALGRELAVEKVVAGLVW